MNKPLFTICAVVLALIIAGCASEPEPAPEVPAPKAEKEEAGELRETITSYELQGFAQADFDAAEVQYAKGEELYGSDNAGSKIAYDASVVGYSKVIRAAFPTLTRRRGEETEAVRADSEGLKAPVAVPVAYAEAEAAYQKALASEKGGNYERALEEFDEAKRLYDAVYAETADKKARADEALAAAERGIADAEARARELETAEKTGGVE